MSVIYVNAVTVVYNVKTKYYLQQQSHLNLFKILNWRILYKFITYVHTSCSTESNILRFVFCFSYMRKIGVSVCESTSLQCTSLLLLVLANSNVGHRCYAVNYYYIFLT